jgi:hypothetical protein
MAMVTLLLASASMARAQVNVGIRIANRPPRGATVCRHSPGPTSSGSTVINIHRAHTTPGHNGYWTRPPYEGAYWVAPHHVGGQYDAGRWEGTRGNVSHQHGWDKSQQRDGRRDPHDVRK